MTFQWEQLADIARELLPLLRKHWLEVEENKDLLPLDPAWDLMFAYERVNLLKVFTIRSDTLLVGYLFLLFPPSLHYASSRFAWIERFWLAPAFRRGMLGVHLFKAAEALARAVGADMLLVAFRLHFSNRRGKKIEALLERLGYEPSEATWVKKLK